MTSVTAPTFPEARSSSTVLHVRKNRSCDRCRQPRHVVMKVPCTCTAKCDHPFCNSTVKPWFERVEAPRDSTGRVNAGSSMDGTTWKYPHDQSMRQRKIELRNWLAQHGHLLTDLAR